MNKLYFATTNKGKLKEASEILGCEVVGTPLEIEEIQSLDLDIVAVQKAKDYYQQIKKPLFVEDGSMEFSALNGLPGTYINDFLKALGNKGLVELLKGKKDRRAKAMVEVVYIPKKGKVYKFVGSVKGTIAKRPMGKKGFGWDAIFIPDGQIRTFGQMNLEEKNKYSMRDKALKKFKRWLQENNQ